MTKYTIQYTDLAIKDIKNTVYYIKNILDNPKAAIDMIDLITDACNSLSNMPERYPLMTGMFSRQLNARMMPIKNYIIIYRVDNKSMMITISRILNCLMKRNG
ncbi:MAG: type II toxin-antitoxin system RelE/ParE family toxin [Bacilli bacterium]|nr:type II toxin-antitoxin system RelE/ParE family toxin [Bacilli bacterium]